MELSRLVSELSLNVVCGDIQKNVSDVYVCDLLSRASVRATEGCLWITVITNKNTVAVASLAKVCAVLLAEGTELMPDALDSAKEHNITVLSSPLSAYELCARIGK